MIYRYRYGAPFETEAVICDIPQQTGEVIFGHVQLDETGWEYACELREQDIIYGLGENVRGINKRGFEYISNATDEPRHCETTRSLYGGHNFILILGSEPLGLFFDYPSRMVFDLGYTRQDRMTVRCEAADLDLYMITGDTADDVVQQFRSIIGRSYIAPRFSFGYGQSRWGYRTQEDFREVVRRHREAKIPLDMVYMDIDYMERFKDFTVNPEEFPDFPAFVQEMKDAHIQLVPIIDAGVKVEEGYDVYEEGVEKGYFCVNEDGSCFQAAVWPGYTHFPDVLNPEAREWFGNYYKRLIDAGIEGFWNDMCEPAIFYTPEGIAHIREKMKEFVDCEENPERVFEIKDLVRDLENAPEDYRRIYHRVNGELICHEKVHNLFGYGMTRAAGEAFERYAPGRRKLIFSRSSYIGAHRYGGIWMGDNLSWWSHLKMNLAMLPSLNMCGFLYTGADLGGFGADATRDLVLRWLALGVFTPLMRNHSCDGTRRQEFWQFEKEEDFRSVIGVRYRLIPYLYSTYMKAALRNEMMFRPLGFEFPEDPIARECEDQLLLGHECMIAPVMQQNAFGRVVYLPEPMLFLCFRSDGSLDQECLPAGHHYIRVALNEVPLFIRQGCCIPLAQTAEYVDALDTEHLQWIGDPKAPRELYEDDGFCCDYDEAEYLKIY